MEIFHEFQNTIDSGSAMVLLNEYFRDNFGLMLVKLN